MIMASERTYQFKRKFKLFAWFLLGYGIFYIFPNFYAPWTPSLLPLTWIDRNVSFLPWTFLIYTSDYLLIFLSILIINEESYFLRFSRMMFATLVICGFFFLAFPTTYPRPAYPISNQWMVQAAMDLVYVADTPNNCFPSMHVALTSVSAWSLRGCAPKYFKVFVIWALAIILSTLTTKQHYFVDILGGLGVLVGVVALEEKFFFHYLRDFPKIAKNSKNSEFTKVF